MKEVALFLQLLIDFLQRFNRAFQVLSLLFSIVIATSGLNFSPPSTFKIMPYLPF